MELKFTEEPDKKESEVEVFAAFKYDGEWYDYSFRLDYEQYQDRERVVSHAKTWAEKKKAKLKADREQKDDHDLKGDKLEV